MVRLHHRYASTTPTRWPRSSCIPPRCWSLSDASAHITQFSEAGQPSELLGHWVRERHALPIETAVRFVTGAPAEIFGLTDRGRLALVTFANLEDHAVRFR